MSADFDLMTAVELRRRVATREVSPVELTKRALARAEATQGTLNAFFVLLPEEALAAAQAAEDAVMRGDELGLLHGLPFSAKDLMAVSGVRYASGSRAMAGNIAAVDAPAVAAREGRGRHPDRQDHDKRVRLQAGRGQSAHRHHAPSVEPGQDSGWFERGRGRLGRSRHHAVCAWYRRRRLGSHSVLLLRPRGHQGAVRARAGMAGLGYADARSCRPDRTQRRRRGPAADGDRRL